MSWFLNQLSTILLRVMVAGLNGIADLFVGVVTLNGDQTLDLFWTLFLPGVKNGGNAWLLMVALGLFILYMIFVFQLGKSYLGPLSTAEHPVKLVAKTIIFAILVMFSATLCGWFIDIATLPFAAVENEDTMGYGISDWGQVGLGDRIEQIAQSAYEGILDGTAGEDVADAAASGAKKIWNAITHPFETLKKAFEKVLFEAIISWFGFLIVFTIVANYMRFIIEIAERYVILGVLSLFSPLCIATGVSDATSNTFKSWFRVMVSQVILMILAMFFVKVFQGAITRLNSLGNNALLGGANGKLANGADYHPFVGLIFVLCWLRIATRVDNYMGTLGLTAMAAGDGLFADMLAGAKTAKAIAGAPGAMARGAAAAASPFIGAAALGRAINGAGGVGFKQGLKGSMNNLKNGAVGFATSEKMKQKHPGIAKTAQNLAGWRNRKKGEEGAKDAKTSAMSAHDLNNKQGVKTTGENAKEALKERFGDVQIGDSGQTLNEFLANGGAIKNAELDADGGVATVKDAEGRESTIAFGQGEGKDGKEGAKSASIMNSDMKSSLMKGADNIKPEGQKDNAEDVLKTNEDNGGGGGPDDDPEIKSGEGGPTDVTPGEDGPPQAADSDQAAELAALTAAAGAGGGGVSPTANEGEAVLKGGADNVVQDSAAGGEAAAMDGSKENVSGLVGRDGKVKAGVPIKKDPKTGQEYIVGNNNKKVPVAKFGENGYRVNGMQQALAKNRQAKGLDNKAHDASNIIGADGKVDKTKLQNDGKGNHFYTANDGAIIPAKANGDIEAVHNGISQSGMALNSENKIANISGALNSDGSIDTSKAQSDGANGMIVEAADGSSVGVNMSTGGVAGLDGDAQTVATAVDSKGNTHDVSSYIGADNKVNPALLTEGTNGGQVLNLGNGIEIEANADGTLNGMSVSEGIGMAGADAYGELHDVSASVDRNTGLAKPEAIKTDDMGSYITSSDNTRIAVDSTGKVNGAVSKSSAMALATNPSTGQKSVISNAASAAGGFMLGAMLMGSGGKASMKADNGSTVASNYSYQSTAPTYSVPSNSSAYVPQSSISPATGTISQSAVNFHTDGTMTTLGLNGQQIPVAEHAPGIYTPMVGASSGGGFGGGGSSVTIDIPDNSPLLSHSYSLNKSLATGFSASTGSIGTHIQGAGGGFLEIAPRGFTSDGGGLQRFDVHGSADAHGQYTYTIGPGGQEQLTKISGDQTFNATGYAGQVSVRTSNSGAGRYRDIASDGMSASGGIIRYDDTGKESSTGAFVMCNKLDGSGTEFVRAEMSGGQIKTYEKSTSFGAGSPVQRLGSGKYAMNLQSSSTITHGGDGTMLFSNGGAEFEMAHASLLGKAAENYPQIEGKHGEKFCMIPSNQLYYNGNLNDFAARLKGCAAGDIIYSSRQLGSGKFTEVSSSSIGRSFGKGRSGDAYYVDDGNGSFRLATRQETEDHSIPKFTQALADGTGNVQSVYNKKGNQSAEEVAHQNGLVTASNGENGIVYFSTRNAELSYDANDETTHTAYALIPADGTLRHTLAEGYAVDGQDIKTIERGGMQYYFAKIMMDKNNQPIKGMEAFVPPRKGSSVFGTQVKTSLGRIGLNRTGKMTVRDNNEFFSRKK